MPNGDAALATGRIESGLASRIGRYNDYTGARQMEQVKSKPKGYSTERAMNRTRNAMRERGMPTPSARQVARTQKNFTAKPKRVSKGRRRKAG